MTQETPPDLLRFAAALRAELDVRGFENTDVSLNEDSGFVFFQGDEVNGMVDIQEVAGARTLERLAHNVVNKAAAR